MEQRVDIVPAMLIVNINRQAEIVFASEQYYEIVGYTEEEIREQYGNSALFCVDKEMSSSYMEAAYEQFSNGKDVQINLMLNCKNHVKKWVCFYAHKYTLDTMLCSIIDYTECYNKFSSLNKNFKELATLTNNLDEAVILCHTDENMTISYANRHVYRLLGYSIDEIKQKHNESIMDFVDEDDKYLLEKVRRNASDKREFDSRVTFINKRGDKVYTNCRGHYTVDDGGNKLIVCVISDITDIVKKTMELMELKEIYTAIMSLPEDMYFEYNILKKSCTNINYSYGNNLNRVIEDFEETMIESGTICEEDVDNFRKLFMAARKGEAFIYGDIKINMPEYTGRVMRISGKTIYDDDGAPIKVIGRLHGIEKTSTVNVLRKNINDLRDSNTELFNLAGLKAIVNSYCEVDAIEKLSISAFILIRIDEEYISNVSDINKDILVENIANTLRAIVRKTDAIGRINENTFCIFIRGLQSEHAVDKEITLAVDAVKAISENRFNCGISLYPIDGNNYVMLYQAAIDAANFGKENNLTYVRSDGFYDVGQRDGRYKYDAFVNSYYSPAIENKVSEYVREVFEKCDSIYDIGKLVIYNISKFFGFSRMTIIHDEDDKVDIISTFGINKNYVSRKEAEQFFVKHREKILDAIEKKSIYNSNYDDDEGLCEEINITALLIIGVKSCDRIVGYVVFEKDTEGGVFNKTEVESAFAISRVVSMMLYKYITERRIEKQLKLEERSLRDVNLSTSLYIIDKDTYELIFINKGMKENFGVDTCRGKCYKTLMLRDTPCKVCPINNCKNNIIDTVEAYYDKIDKWICSMASEVNYLGGKGAYIVNCADISDVVNKISTSDSVTGLDSFENFKLKVESKLSTVSALNYVIIVADLDKFKYVNEAVGYEGGNEVLIEFADAIKECIFSDELICRSSADRFVILLEYDDEEEVLLRINKMHERLRTFVSERYPYLFLYTTFGVYFIKSTDYDLATMIDKANMARLSIKNERVTGLSIYDNEMHDNYLREKEIESKMGRALANREFVVYFQPKVDVCSNKIVGAEALVRWRKSDGTIIPPDEFVPLFEKNGFIIDVDFYVYEEVFKMLSGSIRAGRHVVPISINISRVHLTRKNFIDRFTALAQSYNIPSSLVELEITESTFLSDTNNMVSTVSWFREHGYKVSIDDFGSGYSSLNLLKNLSIDVLNLDKEFFPENDLDIKSKAIFENVVKLTKDLHIEVLAEGVETKQQAAFLKELNCDMAQGYLYSRPVPKEDFEKLLVKGIIDI